MSRSSPLFHRQIHKLPAEMVEKILLDAAISEASPVYDNNDEIFRKLKDVCGFWKEIVNSDHFLQLFQRRLRARCALWCARIVIVNRGSKS